MLTISTLEKWAKKNEARREARAKLAATRSLERSRESTLSIDEHVDFGCRVYGVPDVAARYIRTVLRSI